MSRLIHVSVAGLLVLFVAAAAAAAPSAPRLLGCDGKTLLRPPGLVVLSCADANSEIRGTQWLTWGRSSASGITTVNLCTPTCAGSNMTFFAHSRVRLLDPKRTRLGLLFSRAVVTYMQHGHAKTFTAYPPTRPRPTQ